MVLVGGVLPHCLFRGGERCRGGRPWVGDGAPGTPLGVKVGRLSQADVKGGDPGFRSRGGVPPTVPLVPVARGARCAGGARDADGGRRGRDSPEVVIAH